MRACVTVLWHVSTSRSSMYFVRAHVRVCMACVCQGICVQVNHEIEDALGIARGSKAHVRRCRHHLQQRVERYRIWRNAWRRGGGGGGYENHGHGREGERGRGEEEEGGEQGREGGGEGGMEGRERMREVGGGEKGREVKS